MANFVSMLRPILEQSLFQTCIMRRMFCFKLYILIKLFCIWIQLLAKKPSICQSFLGLGLYDVQCRLPNVSLKYLFVPLPVLYKRLYSENRTFDQCRLLHNMRVHPHSDNVK